MPLPKQNVEINPKHPLIVGIHKLTKTEPTLARVLAEQVFDNCLVAAGILDDGRSMLPRLNDILLCVVNDAHGIHGRRTRPPARYHGLVRVVVVDSFLVRLNSIPTERTCQA